MSFHPYLLRCIDGSFYAGHAYQLEVRLAQHATGPACAFAKRRRPVTLAWSQDFPSRLEALEAERRVKGWSRAKKQALIAGDRVRLCDLARSRPATGRPSASSGRTDPVGTGT